MALTIPSRTPWEDRFRTPGISELRGALAPQFLGAFDHARVKLAQIQGASEAIRWHGVWKWTFEYAGAGTHQEPFAFLVPDPARPRVCVSILESAMAGVDVRKLAKGVREVLAAAPAVDGTRWATWDVTTKSGVEEIAGLIASYRTPPAAAEPAPAAPAPAASKARDAKVKPEASNGVAQANGTGTPSPRHKAGSTGTRRSRGG